MMPTWNNYFQKANHSDIPDLTPNNYIKTKQIRTKNNKKRVLVGAKKTAFQFQLRRKHR